MSEETVMVLPEDWEDNTRDFSLIAEAEYAVMVHRATRTAEDRAFVELVILDDGPFAKRHLFQTFVVTTEGGKRGLAEFLEAVGVVPQNRIVDLAACAKKLLRVQVKHGERDGKVYANVVRFAKATGQ